LADWNERSNEDKLPLFSLQKLSPGVFHAKIVIVKPYVPAGDVVQVEKHLPSKFEALSSNPRTFKTKQNSQVPTAHACNSSLLYQEAEIRRISLKPAQANSFMRPYLKKPHHKIGLVELLNL
jgi:hypothetical protein